MALVSYSSSSDENEAENEAKASTPPPPAKKRKTETTLPPLPNAFRDLYSSTVRTTTSDDPSLHGGRRRVTPHIEGQWPGHVYLEYNPNPKESEQLSQLIASEQRAHEGCRVQSLLSNDLGVTLPLHVSLSRPLSLLTPQKSPFLTQLKDAVSRTGVRTFDDVPGGLRWHPNELRTRWFLVLQLRKPAYDELAKLLRSCNDVAKAFGQPLLYAADDVDGEAGYDAEAEGERKHEMGSGEGDREGKFHISLAWSLTEPKSATAAVTATATTQLAHSKAEKKGASTALALAGTEMKNLSIWFSEVKVRIGQDVHSLPLPAARGKKGGLFA
ncbi:poly(U)-specific 3'-to-5' RNA exonuclease [Elasticomyces elasticus]|uniref:U6 snRNA phosphodiesterase n=1 Tax=Elasticomyces elasticus TaxID=574655 RepID=A0AAN7W270_9PEZI|nr:poly(U)-specific 3'-to-5' RNA exonuclease [Elasticomyces elasticus]